MFSRAYSTTAIQHSVLPHWAAGVPCRRSPGNLRRYTHTRRGRVTHLFFPSRRCRYCCAPPHRRSHHHRRRRRRIRSLTAPPLSLVPVRAEPSWPRAATPVTTEDRFRRFGGGDVAKRLGPLRVFCFVFFLIFFFHLSVF